MCEENVLEISILKTFILKNIHSEIVSVETVNVKKKTFVYFVCSMHFLFL